MRYLENKPERECKLCLRARKLCRSHIIPEFIYRELYDDNNRMVVFPPDDVTRAGQRQQGWWEWLLCESCEQLLNDRYEKPFLKYWIDGDALQILRDREVAVLDGIDYANFKLFHLSVLYRAAVSTLGNFAYVKLIDFQLERLRKMVLNGDPGPWTLYPIMAYAIACERGVILDNIVGPPMPLRLEGIGGFAFVFAGCQWTYLIAEFPPRQHSRLCLRESGKLPTGKLPFEPTRIFSLPVADDLPRAPA